MSDDYHGEIEAWVADVLVTEVGTPTVSCEADKLVLTFQRETKLTVTPTGDKLTYTLTGP